MKIRFSIFMMLILVSPALEASTRSVKKFGVTAGLMSDPFPAVMGFSIRYNVVEFLQVNLGFGQSSSFLSSGSSSDVNAQSFGAGARFFGPDLSLSPFAGLQYSYLTGSGTLGLPANSSSLNLEEDFQVLYVTMGVDYQNANGFNLGGGVHYILSPSEVVDFASILPNVYIGWFF